MTLAPCLVYRWSLLGGNNHIGLLTGVDVPVCRRPAALAITRESCSCANFDQIGALLT